MKKIMRKCYYLTAGMVLVLMTFLMVQNVSAAETVPVTEVSDITDVQTVTSHNFDVGSGKYSQLVQFTLEKPAYVYVAAYSTVMFENWTNLGAISDFAVYSDENCSNIVKNDKNMEIWGNGSVQKYLCLDAGNYWIYFAKDDSSEEYLASEGEFRLSVAAQYLDVTATKNGSWARAKAISTDKKVTGFLSSSTRTSWYKFTVAEGTAAKISVSLDNPMGKKYFDLSPTGVTLYKSTHKYITSFNVTDNTYYETGFSPNVILSAGTYYIAVTGDESYSRYETAKLEKNEFTNMGGVNLNVTTIKKTSISKLSNTKGKKAQVTYKAVSDAAGYEIQYSTDSKFKKGVKTVEVNAKTTKVTIQKLTLKKKYFVRVRAYRFDEYENRLAGAWSVAKNVSITK